MPTFRTVDPKTLLLPTPRQTGAVPWKLQRQIRLFGSTNYGMPPIWVEEDSDGQLRIIDGLTRAVRIAKLIPGQTVIVEVTEKLNSRFRTTATVADVI